MANFSYKDLAKAADILSGSSSQFNEYIEARTILVGDV